MELNKFFKKYGKSQKWLRGVVGLSPAQMCRLTAKKSTTNLQTAYKIQYATMDMVKWYEVFFSAKNLRFFRKNFLNKRGLL